MNPDHTSDFESHVRALDLRPSELETLWAAIAGGEMTDVDADKLAAIAAIYAEINGEIIGDVLATRSSSK